MHKIKLLCKHSITILPGSVLLKSIINIWKSRALFISQVTHYDVFRTLCNLGYLQKLDSVFWHGGTCNCIIRKLICLLIIGANLTQKEIDLRRTIDIDNTNCEICICGCPFFVLSFFHLVWKKNCKFQSIL